jgi:hypothetical protein
MEWEERKELAGEASHGKDFATFIVSGASIPDSASAPAPPRKARLWHECMARWIRGAHRGTPLGMAARLGREGTDPPPTRGSLAP